MNYIKLAIMSILSFISMYILMYIMVDNFTNVYPNLNQFYMAALMTVPMVILELILMQSMYNNNKANIIIIVLSIITFILLISFIRKQTAITDKEFLKSMIPHHAGAILMCNQASLKDPELKKLCDTILKTQQEEIDFMKSKLKAIS